MKTETLRVRGDVKNKFDKLQFEYKMRGIRKSQSEILEILINCFKKNNQSEKKESKELEVLQLN